MDNSDKQMEMLLEEGGIADDGMNVDPVSGNEIPPGSMASEVRDDVPAQLSEGEYVVPADVLRFYGVKFFEDLRSQAKQGLMDMEQNGRIGGEPVPAGGPQMGGEGGEDLTPEEMAVLQEMGMAVGGMVPQPTQSTSPYMQQQQLYQQPSPVAMGNVGYAPGGLEDGSNATFDPEDYATSAQTEALTTAAFNPADYGRGSAIDRVLNPPVTQAPELRVVTLYGPNGEVRTLTLPVQQDLYDQLVQEGYSEEQVATTTETSVGVDDRGPDEIGTDTTGVSVSIGDMNASQVADAFSNTFDPENEIAQVAPTVAGLLAGPIAGLAAKGVVALNNNQRDALQAQAQALGLDLSTISDPNQDLSRENFVSDAFFSQAMESVAPPNMSYNEETGGYDATGSLAPTSSPTPSSIPGHPSNQGTESESTGLQGIADSISNAVDAVADALGISGDSDSSSESGSNSSASEAADASSETGGR